MVRCEGFLGCTLYWLTLPLLILGVLLTDVSLYAFKPVAAAKRSWGPEQLTGPPDTPAAGDQSTAWASQTQDGQPEWLLLEYAVAVQPRCVLVYETYNPGALQSIAVIKPDGSEQQVWTGADPVRPGQGKGVSAVAIQTAFKVKRVKLYLDSPAVQGWNEIDAVGLQDTTGATHWVVKAEASSTYASRGNNPVLPQPPIAPPQADKPPQQPRKNKPPQKNALTPEAIEALQLALTRSRAALQVERMRANQLQSQNQSLSAEVARLNATLQQTQRELAKLKQSRPSASQIEVRKLILQLQDNRFAQREAATTALIRLGRDALGEVAAEITHADLEVRTRVQRILSAWIQPDDEELSLATLSILEKMAESREPARKSRAREILARHRDFTIHLELQTANVLQKAGAFLTRDGEGRITGCNLAASRLADNQLAGLKTLKKIERLDLSGASFALAELKCLAELKKLRQLTLVHTGLTSDDVAKLKRLTQLEALNLTATAVDDRSMPHLAALKGVKQLNISATGFTAAGVAELRKRMPATEIIASVVQPADAK